MAARLNSLRYWELCKFMLGNEGAFVLRTGTISEKDKEMLGQPSVINYLNRE